MNKKKTFFVGIIGIIVLALILVGFLYKANSSETIKDVSSEEFENLVNKGVFTLQVHTPYYGEIPGTDLVIEDWKNIERYLDKLPGKETPIALYCRSGSMSAEVADKLKELGYKNIYNLEGGMNEWESSGRKLINKT